jgi:beta-glucosidase
VPIIVTENGISTKDVHKKISFINSHIEVLKKCVDDGIDLGGYFYWTLIDGYEWLEGHGARFGLYNVDSDTLARKPTLAAAYYSHIAKKHLTKN